MKNIMGQRIVKDASHLTYLSLNILFCERNRVRLVQLSVVELAVKKKQNTKQQLMQNLSSGVTLIVVGTTEILTLQTSSVSPATVPLLVNGLTFGDVSSGIEIS